MRVRFAIGLLVFGFLVGCNGGSPTAPKNTLVVPPTPVVTQPPLPEPTPSDPCQPRRNCGD